MSGVPSTISMPLMAERDPEALAFPVMVREVPVKPDSMSLFAPALKVPLKVVESWMFPDFDMVPSVTE